MDTQRCADCQGYVNENRTGRWPPTIEVGPLSFASLCWPCWNRRRSRAMLTAAVAWAEDRS